MQTMEQQNDRISFLKGMRDGMPITIQNGVVDPLLADPKTSALYEVASSASSVCAKVFAAWRRVATAMIVCKAFIPYLF